MLIRLTIALMNSHVEFFDARRDLLSHLKISLSAHGDVIFEISLEYANAMVSSEHSHVDSELTRKL